MYVRFLFLGVLAAFIMLGLWYRASAILFFLGFTYVFLIDQANYLNHFYLISLLSFMMIFVPAHRMASLDALRRPEWQASTGPAWSLWLLRFQVGVAYFFAELPRLMATGCAASRCACSWLPERNFPSSAPCLNRKWWST